MSRVVWKFETDQRDYPAGKVVHVGALDGEHYIWIELETEDQDSRMELAVIGTGQTIPLGAEHRGTFVDPKNGEVWHVYERYVFSITEHRVVLDGAGS